MPDRPAYIIVIGAGKVGFYLSRHLLEGGYEVALIEKDPARAALVGAQLGSCASLVGDGDEMSFLSTSGIERADVVAAVTGDDEDNLIACQLAKRQFHVPRTIARVNNPRNVQLFHQLGVDVAVSATELILGVIESGLASHGDVLQIPMGGSEASLVRVTVPAGPIVGRQAMEITDLASERMLLIVRNGHEIPSEMPLEAGDQIVLFTQRPASDFTLEVPALVSPGVR
ncbi:MAG TPA: TrkA family potassium uptake protein [Candidatus Dormibacteraeota bacterium]|nr:TrkA family potassium uptake protein [Candidatus Dormibacteraeota bacterium]